MPTLKEIREEVAMRSGWLTMITATSGTSGTIVDTVNLKDSGGSTYDWVDQYIKCVSATQAGNVGLVRRVASYVPTSGTLIPGQDYPATVTAGDIFEVLQIDPVMINDSINTALRRCTTIKRTNLTYSAGDTSISLATQDWVLSEDYVLGLRYRYGATANQYTWRELSPYEWRATSNAGVVSLEFDVAPFYGTNIALEMKSIGPYVVDSSDELTTDASSTACPLDWIVAMTTIELISRIGKNADLQARSILRLDRELARQEATDATMKFAPAISYEMRN